ncbi:hypothetical protein C4561_03375 [candidate division WWE3 bacterium]|jgi:hypothetical protein|uniref:Uncharacterized protein n=1 Tax=candidate division WWE3 bacterium TaxID=2053526 RepID=A0A3A4ZIX3_UNCKA|nr:MAG: hypothetical protein C4561_03375 [candidate division WWE3 bacterium]
MEEVPNQTPQNPAKKSWYENPGCISLLLVFFFPLGLLLMWVYTNWDKKIKWAVTLIILFLIVLGFAIPTPSAPIANSTTINNTQTKPIPEIPEPVNEEASVVETVTEEPVAGELTAAEQEYLQKILKSTQNLTGAFSVIGEMADEPLKVYDDQDYIMRLAVAIITIQQEYKTATEIIPPTRFQDIHKDYTKALSLYTAATEELTYGIDSYDPDKINKAADLMEEASVYLNSATEKMTAIQ